MNNILYTYSNTLFQELKQHIEEKEDVLFSFSYLESFKPDEYSINFIDITSLITTLSIPNQSTYNAEKFFDNLKVDYKLIIEEKLAFKAMDMFKFHISSIEKLELFTKTNDETSEEIIRKKRKLIIDLNKEETEKCIQYINDNLIGHNLFKKRISEEIKDFQIFHKLGEDKILSIFIMGKSGVGKTEVGRLLHKFLDSEGKLIKINFGNYSSHDSLNSLIGSPRGYIGSDSGELTEKLNKSNSGIILIDEFEKADQKVFHFFLELLEDGKFTDTQGVEYDLSGFIIIFTSNLMETNFDDNIFPELKSRFNYICEFQLLSTNDKKEFKKKRINELICNYNDVFEEKLEVEEIINELDIDVTLFDNIRNLNSEIRKKFTEYCK